MKKFTIGVGFFILSILTYIAWNIIPSLIIDMHIGKKCKSCGTSNMLIKDGDEFFCDECFLKGDLK